MRNRKNPSISTVGDIFAEIGCAEILHLLAVVNAMTHRDVIVLILQLMTSQKILPFLPNDLSHVATFKPTVRYIGRIIACSLMKNGYPSAMAKEV